ESPSARFHRLHGTHDRNHPAISSRPSFPGSTYPLPAKSACSRRSNPRFAATNFLPSFLHTKSAPKSPYLPDPATFSPAYHSNTPPSTPDTPAPLPPSIHHSAPPASRRNTASALHTPTTIRCASAPDNSASPAPPAADTSHSTNENI